MRRIGKKTVEWQKARAKLIDIYREKGITRCELCGSTWALSFHHLNKRSSGRAKHTFEDTRLLCVKCHDLAEYDKEVNNGLRKLR